MQVASKLGAKLDPKKTKLAFFGGAGRFLGFSAEGGFIRFAFFAKNANFYHS